MRNRAFKQDYVNVIHILATLLNSKKIDYLVHGSGAYLVHGVKLTDADHPQDIDLSVKDFKNVIKLLQKTASIKENKLQVLEDKPGSTALIKRFNIIYQKGNAIPIDITLLEEFGLLHVKKTKIDDISVPIASEVLLSIFLRLGHQEIRSKDEAAVQQLIKINPELINTIYPPDQLTLLHFAVKTNLSNMVKILVASGAQLEAKDRAEKTPLNYAIKDSEIQGYLQSMSDRRLTALHLAANDNQVNLIKVIGDRKEDINALDIDACTAAHYAAAAGHHEFLLRLAESKAKLDKPNFQIKTPLHLAVKFKKLAAVDALAQQDININAQDDKGRTPLHEAVIGKSIDIVCKLLLRGASLEIKDNSDKIPPQYVKPDSEMRLLFIAKSRHDVLVDLDRYIKQKFLTSVDGVHDCIMKQHALLEELFTELKRENITPQMYIKLVNNTFIHIMELTQAEKLQSNKMNPSLLFQPNRDFDEYLQIFSLSMKDESSLTITIDQTKLQELLKDSKPIDNLQLNK
jgi:ankyrin repeat protein